MGAEQRYPTGNDLTPFRCIDYLVSQSVVPILIVLLSRLHVDIVVQTKDEGSNLYGQENTKYPVLQTYEEGGVMEIKVVFSTYHWVR